MYNAIHFGSPKNMPTFNLIHFYFIYIFWYIPISAKDYGHSDIKITGFEICKGPKRVDCADTTFKMKNNLSVTYRMDLKKDITLTNGKIEGTCKGQPKIKYQMKNPCDNLLIKSLLKTFVNISDNCSIVKGKYEFLLDVKDISQKYYNGVYFYGDWTYKSVFYANSCNVMCCVIEMLIIPKPKF